MKTVCVFWKGQWMGIFPGMTPVAGVNRVQFAGSEKPVHFRELAADTYRAFAHGSTHAMLFQSEADFDKVWPSLVAKTNLKYRNPAPAKPQIDFNREVVLLALIGWDSGRDQDGKRVESVTFDAHKRMLSVKFKKPQPRMSEDVREAWAMLVIPKPVTQKAAWYSIGQSGPMEAKTGANAEWLLNGPNWL
jgi:hypothetical protein